LQEVLTPGAKVPLLSCSVAKREGAEPSFAEVMHEALPHVVVYGPDRDTGGWLLFRSNAEFKAIYFPGANRLAFYPGYSEPTIEQRPSWTPHGLDYLVGYSSEHPLLATGVLGFIFLTGASLYDAIRSTVSRLVTRYRSRNQTL
jgi:hypothetical protein